MQSDNATMQARKGASEGGKTRLLCLEDLDARTRAARRVRDLTDAIESDLGGADYLSAAQRQLAQRAAVLSAILEHAEASWVQGSEPDLADYLAGTNALRRLLATIGLERRARDMTPDPLTYAAQRAAEASQ